MQSVVRSICNQEKIAVETLRPLSGGQINQVFLVNDQYVIRIGARQDAYLRLQRETSLLQRLAGSLPVPHVYAFGEHDGQVYQIQQYVSGAKLYQVWGQLAPAQQDQIVSELAGYRKTLASLRFPDFGLYYEAMHHVNWADFITTKFQKTLAEIAALNLRMAPGFLDLAAEYFAMHQTSLAGGAPCLVHGDLWLGNILVEQGHITALLDFEFALQAPQDYELLKIEDFSLYPNDYAEEGDENFCAADFAGFCQLLRKHDAALFETPRLRERLNLYHLEAALSDHLEWRKANLTTIPPEMMAAKTFYMARITNFIFDHGAHLF